VTDLAAGVVEDSDPAVHTFDLMDDEGWGLGLGCNGITDILLEPLDDAWDGALEGLRDRRRSTVAEIHAAGESVTVFVDWVTPAPDLLLFGTQTTSTPWLGWVTRPGSGSSSRRSRVRATRSLRSRLPGRRHREDRVHGGHRFAGEPSPGHCRRAQHRGPTAQVVLEDDGHDPSIHGGVGEAGGQIVELAARLDGDFVVVGGKRRSPLGNAVLGRTAQGVLSDATCAIVYTGARVEA
jgi:nucleotide-binding universal stress UspA family protein